MPARLQALTRGGCRKASGCRWRACFERVAAFKGTNLNLPAHCRCSAPPCLLACSAGLRASPAGGWGIAGCA
jgi:hypothetical protein